MSKNTSVWDSFANYGKGVILPKHNNPALFSRWLDNLRDMETQILCDVNGDPIPDSNKYEKDGQTWGPIRWPYQAASESPNYSNPPMSFLLSDHLVAIGSTGWNWRTKESYWLGYDFDSLIDHSVGVGITEAELEEVVARAPEWVEVIRSTRGNGRHLYIHFKDPFPKTKTHTEHAALARAFLPILATASGLDLSSSVDVCGSVLWLHHQNSTPENKGYSLARASSKQLTDADCPPNWRDHIEVVSGGRNTVRVRGWFEEMDEDKLSEGDELDEMTQAYSAVKLDEAHHQLLDDLAATGYSCLWVGDHNLVQTHTAALKRIYDNRKESGCPMKGVFDTNTSDGDPGKPNCFMRPKLKGAWDVYRFGAGTTESPLWDKHGTWTHTTLNAPASLAQIANLAGGYENPDDKLGYLFSTYADILKALESLGSKVEIPLKGQSGRSFSLRPRKKDGKLIIGISKERKDAPEEFPRWAKTPRGWERMVEESEICTDKEQEDEEIWAKLDERCRMLKCVSYEDLGSIGGAFDAWVLKDDTGKWVKHPRENITPFLTALNYDPTDLTGLLGGAIFRSWSVVNEPFTPEFPGGRIWNMGASQYVYTPLDLAEGQSPKHPHWDLVMRHCGVDLDSYIPDLPWCKEWGITNGGDYLTAWIACMLRHPFLKLPYLFMYGPQNSGKSIFHEAIATLVTRGVVKADRAITSSSGYNGELLNAILGVIDEVDISKAGSSVYNKLKEWTTALTLSVHAKYKQVYEARSSLHFVQLSNTRSSLPVLGGDTRITAMNVPLLEREIPKETLMASLHAEGPSFMRTLMDWTIPDAIGRLKLPVIETQSKDDAMASNRNPLEAFLEDRCYKVDGAAITLADFRNLFLESLDQLEASEWSTHVVKRALSEHFPVGIRGAKQYYIGNLSLQPCEPSEPFAVKNNRLVRATEL